MWGLKRFLTEAQILARFRHAHIVQVYRVFEARGTAYMVTEYVEGRTLAAEFAATGPLSESRTRAVLAALTDGLSEVHAAGLLHRDIKPANVMVRADGSPVLIDFGSARQAIGRQSRSVTAVLTPGYAPIEQYSARGKQGPWTDIYALGAVAYWALSGVVPADATERVLADDVRPVGEVALRPVSESFGAAVDAAVSVNAADRPQSLQEWRALLDGAAGRAESSPAGSGAGVFPPGPGVNVADSAVGDGRGGGSRGRWLLGAAAAGAVVVALLFGWNAMRSGSVSETEFADSEGVTTAGDPPPVPARSPIAPVEAGAEPEPAETGPAGVVPPPVSDPAPVLSPAAAEAALSLDRAARRAIQEGLAASGFDPGAPDGMFGPGTRERIRAWQAAQELPASGYLDGAQASMLREQADAAGRVVAVPDPDPPVTDPDPPVTEPPDPVPDPVAVENELALGLDVARLRLVAEQGDAIGQNELGFMYQAGRGVARDDAEAVRWYRRAAEQGDASGQNSLGFMYQNGRGVARDDAEAVRWYRRAAEQGHASGQNNLGFMYWNGRGVARDDAEAVRWYRRAAEQGQASGQNNLGFMYQNGRGVARDDAEAVRWYRRAAEQGHASGQNNLGFMYQNGRGVARDDAEAVRWYRRAAEQGQASGQNNLGFMYQNGRGVARDDAEAVRWYRRAAEQGQASGPEQPRLHVPERSRRGARRRRSRPLVPTRRRAGTSQRAEQPRLHVPETVAAWRATTPKPSVGTDAPPSRGHASGQNNLGFMYQNGRGVARDGRRSRPLVPTRRRAGTRQRAEQPRLHVPDRSRRGARRRRSRPLVPTRRRAGTRHRAVQPRLHVRRTVAACGGSRGSRPLVPHGGRPRGRRTRRRRSTACGEPRVWV